MRRVPNPTARELLARPMPPVEGGTVTVTIVGDTRTTTWQPPEQREYRGPMTIVVDGFEMQSGTVSIWRKQ